MKKILTILIISFIIGGCGTTTGMANNEKDNKKASGESIVKKDYSGFASVELSSSISVGNTVSGADTPTEEAGKKLSDIKSVTVTISDSKGKELNTVVLNAVNASMKGEIARFSGGFVGVPAGNASIKYIFSDSSKNKLFEGEQKAEFTAKSVFKVSGDVNQVSIKREPQSEGEAKVSIEKMDEKSYTSGELLLGFKDKMKEEDLKSLLEKSGITITNVKIGIIANSIMFSSPSVAEALIIISSLNKFDYVEPNYIASL
jgi:hypothetical protein